MVTVNRFKIELATYAANYGAGTLEVNKIIQGANYTRPDLVKIVNLINGENAQTTAAISSKGGTRFFIGAAIIGSQLKYSGSTDLAYNSKNQVNYYPQIGVGVDFFQNISTRKLVLRAEIDAYSAEIKSVSANAVKTVQTLTFTVQPQILYNFYDTETLKAFLGTGFMVHFSSYSKNTYEVTNAVYTSSNKTSELSSTWYAIPVKAGITLNNRIQLYGAYHFGTMVEDNTFAGYRASMDAFTFGLNYTFGKR